MTHITTENTFETAIVNALIEKGGYTFGDSPRVTPCSFLSKDINEMQYLQLVQY